MTVMRVLAYCLTGLLGLWPVLAAAESREATTCGFIKERAMFALWSFHAPSRDVEQVTQHPFVETSEFTTADDKVLRGYKFNAHNEDAEAVQAKGYLLAAMGNAMVSDDMVMALSDMASAGYDVYVYDYRGYADSEGRRRLRAILDDYEELVDALNRQYPRALLYGTSFGGMVMMNVIGRELDFDRAVIDSSPSTLSDHGCPESVDPVRHMNTDVASRILVITGARDSVLGDDMTAPLRDKAAEYGARTYHGNEFAHPFMDSAAVHYRRQQMVFQHLLGLDDD